MLGSKEDFVISLGLDDKEVVAGLNRISGGFARLQKVMGVAIGAKAIHEMARYGHEISNLAAQTGLSVKNFTNLRNAFASAGSSAGAFDRMINHINSGLIGMSIGDGRFAAKLATLGISEFNSNGGLKTADTVMGDIAEWARNQRAFGRSEREVAGLLMQMGFASDFASARELMKGRGGLAADRRRSEERIGSLTNEQAKALTNLNKQLVDLGLAAKETGAALVSDLAPVASEVVDFIRGGVKYAHDHPWARWAMAGGMFAPKLFKWGNKLMDLGLQKVEYEGETFYEPRRHTPSSYVASQGGKMATMAKLAFGAGALYMGVDFIKAAVKGEKNFIEQWTHDAMKAMGVEKGWGKDSSIIKGLDWLFNSGEVFNTAVDKFSRICDWFLEKLGLNDEPTGTINIDELTKIPKSTFQVEPDGSYSYASLPDVTKATNDGILNTSGFGGKIESNVTVFGNVGNEEMLDRVVQGQNGGLTNIGVALSMGG